jgi:hypothetical protein
MYGSFENDIVFIHCRRPNIQHLRSRFSVDLRNFISYRDSRSASNPLIQLPRHTTC